MRLSHLNALRALEASLRLGTFRAAADELGISPAAVGQHIRALEDYVGRPLFDRHPSGARPTEAASAVASRLSEGFAALSEALGDLRSSDHGRRVAVSMTQALAEAWLPAELPGFFARCREVDLRIDTSHRPADLSSGAFDFALRYGPPPAPPLASHDLFPSYVAPVCTADFAARYDLSPDTRSLDGVPVCEVETHTLDPNWPDWAKWCAAHGVAPPTASASTHFSRYSSGLKVAQAGLGLMMACAVETIYQLRDGTLVMPFGIGAGVWTSEQNGYLYRLVWQTGRRRSPVRRAFRDWIVERAGAHRALIDEFLSRGAGVMR